MCEQIESVSEVLRALSNENRLRILGWLMAPCQHFPPQPEGDVVKDGVCVGAITKKTGLSQPTVTNHLQVLARAGLVTPKRSKNWVFYRPDRARFKFALNALERMTKMAA